ncbi:vexin [Rhinophrynus dorsalis]
MNRIYRHSYENLQTFNTSSSKVCKSSKKREPNTQRTVVNSVAVATDLQPHWTQRVVPQQTDILQVTCRSDEVWRPPPQGPFLPQCTTKHMGISERETSGFRKNKRNKEPIKKSFSTPSVHSAAKQIVPTLSASHVTPMTVGKTKQKSQNTEDEHACGNEASLPLTTRTVPKKAPSLLQKMGLKLKKTVEYIGASNCAFEED